MYFLNNLIYLFLNKKTVWFISMKYEQKGTLENYGLVKVRHFKNLGYTVKTGILLCHQLLLQNFG